MTDTFSAYICEQFSFLGHVYIRKMFGGAALYLDDLIVGIIVDDIVYLKVDETNKADYISEGMGPFTYEGKTKPVAMSYYQLPESVLEDPDTLRTWAEKSLAIAAKSKTKSKKSIQKKGG